MKEQLKNAIEHLVLLPVRVRHRRRARAKHKARIQALTTVRHTLQGTARLNAGSAKTIFNVGMYALLLDQDIAYFTDDLVCAIGDRRRAFLAKHEAVLLYEAGEDFFLSCWGVNSATRSRHSGPLRNSSHASTWCRRELKSLLAE